MEITLTPKRIIESEKILVEFMNKLRDEGRQDYKILLGTRELLYLLKVKAVLAKDKNGSYLFDEFDEMKLVKEEK